MNAAIIAAQQAEAQNATTLILAAVTAGIISQTDANMLTPNHKLEIGAMATPEEVGNYVYLVLHETDAERAARIVQERAVLDQVRQDARNEIQARINARVGPQNQGGSRRRRKQSRKSRKHRR